MLPHMGLVATCNAKGHGFRVQRFDLKLGGGVQILIICSKFWYHSWTKLLGCAVYSVCFEALIFIVLGEIYIPNQVLLRDSQKWLCTHNFIIIFHIIIKYYTMICMIHSNC